MFLHYGEFCKLMFDCDDRPVIKAPSFRGVALSPSPLFRYCGDPWRFKHVKFKVVLRAEINIRAWETILQEIKEGNKRIKWMPIGKGTLLWLIQENTFSIAMSQRNKIGMLLYLSKYLTFDTLK
ncbi:hypothetical protein M9H77_32699 [Catharanthus roseus]|uniref:Uncharacterized protein n=1 Tax=Catharanthus roseus TaxID=4058 RepID=A0ACC0A3N2_CATRO|nr:hypothetical protein M9H77_32699 [Catharanthus roseus]